jgi:putrescine aminotransferase
VVAAVKDQLDSIALGAKAFFSKNGADLAEQLAAVAPAGVQYSFFCNSGTEAVEAALKFARATTGRSKLVSTYDGFHGKTLGALSVMGREKYRKPFEPLLGPVTFVDFGDSQAAANAIDRDTACFIVEPIQGEAGIIVPPDGYLAAVREACDRAGALLIFDEVQTGMGRTGTMFGCEHEGVSPDLMTLAKAIGGGIMPLGVCMGRPEIWEAIYSANPLSHTSTFGGNPLACAAGLATLRVIRDEALVPRSAELGRRLKQGLQQVADRHPALVREVRGRGLMVGFEFQMDEVGELVVAQLLKRGVCVAYALNNPRVLRFEPPLIITPQEIDFAVESVDEALVETSELVSALI